MNGLNELILLALGLQNLVKVGTASVTESKPAVISTSMKYNKAPTSQKDIDELTELVKITHAGDGGEPLIVMKPEGGKPAVVSPDGRHGSAVCWLFVPEYNDHVLVNLWSKTEGFTGKNTSKDRSDAPGIIKFVGPYDPAFELPYGLFFWKSDLRDGMELMKRPPIGKHFVVRKTPQEVPFIWDSKRSSYVMANKKRVLYAPQKTSFISMVREISPAVSIWLQHGIVDRNYAFDYITGGTEDAFKGVIKKMQERGQYLKEGLPKVLRDIEGSDRTLGWQRTMRFISDWSGMLDTVSWCIDTFTAVSVHDLRTSTKKLIDEMERAYIAPGDGHTKVTGPHPHLTILYKSAHKSHITDVSYIQAHVKHPKSMVQVASTFSCLEGDVQARDTYLNSMNKSAVQGENAVIATISGAIVRKYFVFEPDRNLIKNFAPWFGPIDDRVPRLAQLSSEYASQFSTFESMFEAMQCSMGDEAEHGSWVEDSVKRLELAGKETDAKRLHDQVVKQCKISAIAGKVKVGVHHNVSVTSSYLTDNTIPRGDGSVYGGQYGRGVPPFNKACMKPFPTLSQVFTAALNLNEEHVGTSTVSILRGKHDYLPCIMLRGMYEGTFLAYALSLGKEILLDTKGTYTSALEVVYNDPKKVIGSQYPHLFLTLVGAGAFQNKVEWIIGILEELEPIIIVLRLQVVLVVWDGTGVEWSKHKTRLNELAQRINTHDMKKPLQSVLARMHFLQGTVGNDQIQVSVPKAGSISAEVISFMGGAGT